MKVLIVRFSSIGDIVLTTPVIRCLKSQIPNVEIHYLTKASFKIILENNPHINRLWTINKSIDEVVSALKKEKFDYLIDLHHNVRTLSLKWKLGVKAYSFDKLNVQKWKLVKFQTPMKYVGHVVDRYMETVKALGVQNDHLPCDYVIPGSRARAGCQFGEVGLPDAISALTPCVLLAPLAAIDRWPATRARTEHAGAVLAGFRLDFRKHPKCPCEKTTGRRVPW